MSKLRAKQAGKVISVRTGAARTRVTLDNGDVYLCARSKLVIGKKVRKRGVVGYVK